PCSARSSNGPDGCATGSTSRSAAQWGEPMVDEKDRMGDKLRQKEKADEDRFFAERDKALLEKLRREQSATSAPADPLCPKDGSRLTTAEYHGVTVERCPSCQGMWLDAGELEKIATRERDSWLGRRFVRPCR